MNDGNIWTHKGEAAAFSPKYQLLNIGNVQRTICGADKLNQTPYELLTGQSFQMTNDLFGREQGGEFHSFGRQKSSPCCIRAKVNRRVRVSD
jgi:hypothetical protein